VPGGSGIAPLCEGGYPFGRIIGMNETPPPDSYFRYAARMALQGADASLRPDPLVKPEDEREARELRQAGRLN
jgi:hypothetical protein